MAHKQCPVGRDEHLFTYRIRISPQIARYERDIVTHCSEYLDPVGVFGYGVARDPYLHLILAEHLDPVPGGHPKFGIYLRLVKVVDQYLELYLVILCHLVRQFCLDEEILGYVEIGDVLTPRESQCSPGSAYSPFSYVVGQGEIDVRLSIVPGQYGSVPQCRIREPLANVRIVELGLERIIQGGILGSLLSAPSLLPLLSSLSCSIGHAVAVTILLVITRFADPGGVYRPVAYRLRGQLFGIPRIAVPVHQRTVAPLEFPWSNEGIVVALCRTVLE